MPKGGIVYSDADLLRMLDLRAEGLSAAKIAARMGLTKNSVVGALNRIDKETDAHDATPERNGTMPRRWWKDGLASRNGEEPKRRKAKPGKAALKAARDWQAP